MQLSCFKVCELSIINFMRNLFTSLLLIMIFALPQTARGIEITDLRITGGQGTVTGTPVFRMTATTPITIAIDFQIHDVGVINPDQVFIHLYNIRTDCGHLCAATRVPGTNRWARSFTVAQTDLLNFSGEAFFDLRIQSALPTGMVGVNRSRAFLLDAKSPPAPILSGLNEGQRMINGNLSWTAPLDASGINSYLLQAINSTTGETWTERVSADIRQHTTSMLSTSGTVRLSVAAIDNAGNVGPSATRTIIIDRIGPGAPRNARATATAQGVEVIWELPPDPDTAMILIKRGDAEIATARIAAATSETFGMAHAGHTHEEHEGAQYTPHAGTLSVSGNTLFDPIDTSRPHTYTITAIDDLGNIGQSVTVTSATFTAAQRSATSPSASTTHTHAHHDHDNDHDDHHDHSASSRETTTMQKKNSHDHVHGHDHDYDHGHQHPTSLQRSGSSPYATTSPHHDHDGHDHHHDENRSTNTAASAQSTNLTQVQRSGDPTTKTALGAASQATFLQGWGGLRLWHIFIIVGAATTLAGLWGMHRSHDESKQ
jgi:hypothetical protein